MTGEKSPRHGGLAERMLTNAGLTQLRQWASDGLTIRQIAENLGVSPQVVYKLEQTYPAIRDAMTEAREAANRNVENALYKRALGFEYTERKTIHRETSTGSLVEEQETTKTVAPDTAAIIFWLKNRSPDQWSDRQDVNLTGAVGLVQIVDNIPRASEL